MSHPNLKHANCYRATVKVTNSDQSTFKHGDEYLTSSHGLVYVMASCFSEVESIVGPQCIEIEYLGPCYANNDTKIPTSYD
jgi:hypothetical protein